ncbi:MAG: S-layer homology domain-containing protein [bacterium]
MKILNIQAKNLISLLILLILTISFFGLTIPEASAMSCQALAEEKERQAEEARKIAEQERLKREKEMEEYRIEREKERLEREKFLQMSDEEKQALCKNSSGFGDICDHWAQMFIEELILEGVLDTKHDDFRPDDHLTRAELVKLTVELTEGVLEDLVPDKPSFSDMKKSDWFYNYVETAYALDIIKGYKDNTFRPNQEVTREQAMKIIMSAFNIDMNLDPGSPFIDVDTLDWSHDYIITAANNCIIKKPFDRRFHPRDSITRAEVTKILANTKMIYNHVSICCSAVEDDFDEEYAISECQSDADCAYNDICIAGSCIAVATENDTIGYSVGGAKDVNNFRENIKNDYLPLSTDLTYEGLFYDYYFDTGQKQECEKLFCPSFSQAISRDPFSDQNDYYLTVGLNSNIKQSDFERKPLDLVVVLDMSGSMDSSFTKYYYDRFGNEVLAFDCDKPQSEQSEEEMENCANQDKTKMEVANESIVSLLDHLNEDDRFAMVLFDDESCYNEDFDYISEERKKAMKDRILKIEADGGTNMSAGINEANELFNNLEAIDEEEREKRIIMLTDAMPNTGYYDGNDILTMMEENAQKRIYTTLIGIGVDFNTELTEVISKTKGANYYSVHSPVEFSQRMDDEFEYMVTPLVFDLKLEVAATGYEIEKVIGAPLADIATGEILSVDTLFPSRRKSESNQARGGLILLKLKKTSDNASIFIKTSYEDRNGKFDQDKQEIIFNDQENEYFENNGIRKAILLSRYAALLKNWMDFERYKSESPYNPDIFYDEGISLKNMIELSQTERQSMDLNVDLGYKKLFQDFKEYFENEAEILEDEELNREIEVLNYLISFDKEKEKSE